MSAQVQELLRHFSSEYYDPAKARAYYLRTRELKGREEGMSKDQKDVWAVTKSEISKSKKEEVTKNQTGQKTRVEALRQKAEESRQRIEDSINALIDSLDAQFKLLPINKIPADATPAQRAFLEKQNSKTQAINNRKSQETLSTAKKAAAEERKRIGTELSAALTTARDEYKANREATTSKYESAKTTQLNTIRSQVG
jgi:hypothetical protein